MALLRILGTIFLLPGTIVLGVLNISVESDAGILRSLVNMIFWGFFCILAALPFIVG